MTTITAADTPLVQYALRLADNALVLGHRLSEWCGHAPMLEEDIALANIALDLIGQARSLYALCGGGRGRGPRRGRSSPICATPPSYRNVLLVEQPNGDFAVTIARQFLYAAFMAPFWRALAVVPRRDSRGDRREGREGGRLPPAPRRRMADPPRRRHGGEPCPRAGRARRAVDVHRRAVRGRRDRARPRRARHRRRSAGALRPEWDETVDRVLAEATLARPPEQLDADRRPAGRHSEHLGHILADLQFLQRAYPGATW